MCFGVRFSLYLASWLSDFDLLFFCVCGFLAPLFFSTENGGGGARPPCPPPPGSAPDADHHLEAGSDSVEGRRIVNISYLASHIIRKQLNVLVVEKVASATIVSKLSQSGIGLAHLELALKRDSVNGIKLLLKESNGAI